MYKRQAYGFASLVDLLRASHKEGAFRVERDRQGVIRVFQAGSAGLMAPTTATSTDHPSAYEEAGGDARAELAEPEAPISSATVQTPADAPATATKKPTRKRAVKSVRPKAAKAAGKPRAAKKAKS